MAISVKTKEYLTVGRTLEELERQEPQLRAAGFRKRNRCHGQSPYTGEFFQWWDRKGTASTNARRQSNRCVRCGEKVTESSRGKSQWCKLHLKQYREYARNYYHEKLKPIRQAAHDSRGLSSSA